VARRGQLHPPGSTLQQVGGFARVFQALRARENPAWDAVWDKGHLLPDFYSGAGRKPKLTVQQICHARKLLADPEVTIKEIAASLK